jgi:peptide/nickel transport system substrate-binding protein
VHGRMHWERRVAAMLGIVAMSAASLTGCGGTLESDLPPDAVSVTPSSVPKPGGHLVFGLESDPNGFDPTRNAWDNAGIQVANALYDPLVAIDAEGKAQPYLAQSFSANGDYTGWTLRLRPNIRFSNGEELNSDALVAFVNALRGSPITGPPAQIISDVRAVDPLTVQVTTSRPWATLPMLLSGQGGYVVSATQLTDPDGHSKPVGTGPFTLSGWDQDKEIRLVRNPRYWRAGLPYLDAVDFVIQPLGNRRVEMLLSGDMDATAVSLPWDVQALESVMSNPDQAARLSVERDVGDSEKSFLMFNTQKRPLNDVRVRQALAYATDMDALAAVQGWLPEDRARGPFSPGSPYYTAADYPSYDPEKARSLLREYLADTDVRGRKEVTFKLLAPSVGSDGLNALIDQWKQVGINVQLTIVDVKTAVRLAVFGEYDAMMLRYFASPDPDVLWHFFANDTIADTGISLNFTRLRNDDISSGMNEGRATQDPAIRRAAYAKTQRALAEQMPYLWLNRTQWRIVTTTRVHDAHNLTLPSGGAAMPLLAGTHRLTETWVSR